MKIFTITYKLVNPPANRSNSLKTPDGSTWREILYKFLCGLAILEACAVPQNKSNTIKKNNGNKTKNEQ